MEEFVCVMYGHPAVCSVIKHRHKLFCSRLSDSRPLPPASRNALQYHVKRANFQTYLWRDFFSRDPLPSPDKHGWKIEKGLCVTEWTNQPPAPNAVLELTKCSCTTGCDSKRCLCNKSGLSCSAACQCVDVSCGNWQAFLSV